MNNRSSGQIRRDTDYFVFKPLLAGTPADDTIDGTDIAEVLNGLDGDDQISGGGGNDTITGDNGNDDLSGDDGNDLIDGGPGTDLIGGGSGSDVLTGGAGIDAFFGTAGDMNGDILTDFSSGDVILVVEDVPKDRFAISINATEAVVSIDVDGDGSADSIFTLQGSFGDGKFVLIGEDLLGSTVTFITYSPRFPVIGEGVSIDTGKVNGLFNPTFFQGDGSKDFRLTVDRDQSVATFTNSLGVFEIDASGNLVNVRILSKDVTDAGEPTQFDFADVAADTELVFFIIQDGADWARTLTATDTLSFIDSRDGTPGTTNDDEVAFNVLAVNGVDAGRTVFFTRHSGVEPLNPDGRTHIVSALDPTNDNRVVIGFEDRTGGGDMDFQDVVLSVEIL